MVKTLNHAFNDPMPHRRKICQPKIETLAPDIELFDSEL